MDRKTTLFVRTQPTSGEFSHVVLLDESTIRVNRSSMSPFTLKTNGVLYNSTQTETYNALTTLGIVDSLMNGRNVVISCYGAVGVGKYYTLMGTGVNYEHRGIIPRTVDEIFAQCEKLSQTFECSVTFSAVEFCGENAYDLLSYRGPIEAGTGTSVDKITAHAAKRHRDALALLFIIDTNRNSLKKSRFGSRWDNFAINSVIEIKSLVHSEERITRGKLSFLYLVGSVGQLERSMEKSEIWSRRLVAQWETDFRVRGKKMAVTSRRSHLTQFVNVEDAKFVFILNIRMEKEYWKSALYTLMFGQRILNIPFKVRERQSRSTDEIGTCEKVVERLKLELYRNDLLCGRKPVNYLKSSEIEKRELFETTSAYMDGRKKTIKVATEEQVQSAFAMMKDIYARTKEQLELQQKMTEQCTSESPSVRSETTSAEIQTDSPEESPTPVGRLARSGFGFGTASKESKKVDERISVSFFRVKRVPSAPSAFTTASSPTVDDDIFESEVDESGQLLTPESSMQYLSEKEEAFRAYKRLTGKHLHDFFLIQKQLTEKKKEEYNTVVDEYRTNKKSLQFAILRYNGLDNYLSYDDPLRLKEEIDYLQNREIKLADEATKLAKIIRSQKQSDHERRTNLVREFELWYEKKKRASSYQQMLRDPQYVKMGEASKSREDHRDKAINSYRTWEEMYNEAYAIARQWISHAKRAVKADKDEELEFDFLQ